jgi:tripartite-type tricarboxylate transporter receptor subunit TctC
VVAGSLWLLSTGVGDSRHAARRVAPGLPGRRVELAAGTDHVAAFYRGRTVRLIVGYGAGGGYDLYSRLIARHVGRYIPGHPTVIVENMPGAGTLVAANHLYNAAPRDGTVIGNVASHIVHQQLLGQPGVRYDAGRLRILTVPIGDVYLLVAAKTAGIRRFDDLLAPSRKRLTIGATAGGTEVAAVLLREVVGENIRVVLGYDGTSAIRLGLERGDVGGMMLSVASARTTASDKFASGEWLMLAQLTDRPIAELEGRGIPAIPSLTLSDDQKRLLVYGIAMQARIGRLYVLPPDVPRDRAAALDLAFEGALADRHLLAEAAAAHMDIAPIPGLEVEGLVRQYLAMPPGVRAGLARVLGTPPVS